MRQADESTAIYPAAGKQEKRIYFEDEHCAVVYKKAGEDSQTFFKHLFPQKKFAAAVNRLDTPVSGLLIAAFDPQIQTRFSHAFEAGAIQKEYWAICERTGAGNTAKSAKVGSAAVCASGAAPPVDVPENAAVCPFRAAPSIYARKDAMVSTAGGATGGQTQSCV